jgi:hypothetical protein
MIRAFLFSSEGSIRKRVKDGLEVLRVDFDDASAWAVDVGNQEERNGN